MPENVQYSDALCSEGQKSGDGFGSGYGFGIGFGDGFGSGYGFGAGEGDGYGSAFGYGDGHGSGCSSGYGDDTGCGHGDGNGGGAGHGNTAGFECVSQPAVVSAAHMADMAPIAPISPFAPQSSGMAGVLAQISLASFPGKSHEEAIALALEGATDPLLGRLGAQHMQLCAQNHGYLSESFARHLRERFPQVQFRLHANVRVLPEMSHVDLADFPTHRKWFHQAARVNDILGSPAYTLHPGLRARADLKQVIRWVKDVEQIFGCKVGIEGLYETYGNKYLVSSWEEYRELFESGVNYALDLSHVNIVAAKSGRVEKTLVEEMAASSACLELHVSANDGQGDTHQVLESEPWWWDLLPFAHERAVTFSEGNLLRSMRARISH